MSPKKTKLDIERAVAAAAAAQLLADPVVADDATTVSNVSDRGIYGREGDFDEETAGAQVGAGLQLPSGPRHLPPHFYRSLCLSFSARTLSLCLSSPLSV